MSQRSMLEDVYPLSPTQEGMLFHTLNDQGAGFFVGQFGFRLCAELDQDAFEQAWQAVVDRHPALRTGFQWEKVDAPLQVVRREARLPFLRRDWRGRTAQEQRDALRAYLDADRARGFDLSRAPLMRLALFRTGEAEYQLVWTHHHMVLDGWSLGVVYRDVLDAYRALCTGARPRRDRGAPYRDYVAWLKGRDPAASEAFWRQALEGIETATPLGLDPAPPAGAPRTAYLGAAVGADDTRALQALARRARSTLNVVVQGAWALLLSRYAGQDDVVFGAVFNGRPASLPGADETVGLFVNTLPVRVRVDTDAAVLPWIEALQGGQAALLEHEHTPLARVQGWSGVPRGQPLFESLLSFQNFRAETGDVRRGFGVDEVWGTEADEYPLVLAVSPGEDGIGLELACHEARMAPERAERMLAHLVSILAAFAADPGRPLREVPLLDAEERARLLALGRGPAEAYPRGALVHQVIAERAAGWADAVAVVHGARTLTYAALERRAEALARVLRARGVGPESRVALFLDRGAELAVAILAVLKAGGAYVPVDPDYPAERIDFLLRDCGAALVLSRAALAPARPAGTAEVLAIDLDAAKDPAGGEAVTVEVDAENAAYAIYTSGSTGRPKAAVVSHRSLLCYAEAMRAELGLGAGDRFLQFASPSFDVMVEEIFPAWLSGAAVVFPAGDLLGDPAGLMEEVRARGVTAFELPTAFWHEWVRWLSDEGARLPDCVRFVIVGGERVLPERLWQWATLGVPLVHVFGLTETSVTSTTLRLAAGEDASASPNLPVGRPLPNVEVYVLDGRGEPSPLGVAAELFVGGDGVGRGYLGRPALTAERFVPHPHAAAPGARLYRTGDRARWLADGTLEFLGRIDQQVKVRGFRIEPAEVEAVLAAHPAVAQAAVTLRQTAAGQPQLVAYVTPSSEGVRISPLELKEHARRRLPEYMVPAVVVPLEALPLSPNGKLDRRALPDPAPLASAASGAEQAPCTEAEATLARIWAEVLKVERVGIHDDYFELGGDSILSIQIVARARRAGLQLRPRQIFQHPTVARLAGVVQAASAAPSTEAAAGPAPLLPVQRWFLEQEVPERHHWNMPLLLELARPADAGALEAAWRAVVDHHDALRLRYTRSAEGWTQAYAPAGEAPAFDRADLARVDDGALRAEIEQRAAEAQRGLDLQRGPLARALLLDPGRGRPQRLLLAVHHLVMDGVSWRIVLEDLQAAYECLAAGRPVDLPARTTSYGAFAGRLAAHAAAGGFDGEVGFWTSPEREAAAALPVDFPGGEARNPAGSARTVSLTLDEEETRALLQEVPAAFRTQVNDLLLAALARALAPWAGGRLLVDVEGHGREELWEGVDLTRTVGWFTTVYPVLLQVDAAAGPVDALLAVRDALRAVPGSGIGYGALRWLGPRAAVRDRLAALPAAGVRFEYLGRFDGGGEGEGMFRRAGESAGAPVSPSSPRSHLLEASAAVVDGRLELSWSYGEQVHRRETVQALLERCAAELRALAAEARAGRRGAWTAADFPLAGMDDAALRAVLGAADDVEDVFPAPSMAEGMLFEARMAPGQGMYVAQLVFELEGPLDEEALRRAWQGVVDRHAALRSTFVSEGVERPLQVVRRGVPVPFHAEDWTDADAEARLEAYLRDDRARGFDPAAAPPLGLALFRAGPERALMVWSFMQLLLDGWSLPIVFREVMALYDAHAAGRAPAPAPAPAYRGYAAWLARRDPAGAERFWRGELGGVSASTPLGIDHPAAPVDGPAFAKVEAVLAPEEAERVRAAARAHGLTLNTLVQGAWALLLSRYAGEPEVVFGVTVSGRPAELPGVEEMVGVFINTLPVRVPVDAAAPAAEWLAGVQRRQAEMREHEHTPLVQVQGWSGVPHGQPLFESFCVFENYPYDELPGAAGRALRVRQRDTREQSSYPLSLIALPGASEGLLLQLGYDRRRIGDGAAARALEHLRTLLQGLAADPRRPVGRIGILDAVERDRVVHGWNRTEAEFDGPPFIHRWIEERAARRPDAPAVTFEGSTLTYAALNARANRLAHHLRSLGVGPEARVGVCAERSHELVIALLAVLKAGGAYVPLDPSYPAERLAWMACDAAPAAVLAQARTAALLPPLPGVPIVPLELHPFPGGREDDPRVALHPENAAYVIYTSGSTGRPKGVVNGHAGIANRMRWMQAGYPLAASDAVMQKTPFSFDVSVWEFFWPLMMGARLVVARPEGQRDPAYLAELVKREGVTVLHFVPSMLAAFLEGPAAERCGGLRRVFCSGEALPREVAQRALERLPGASLHNLYGPTEAAVDVSEWTCTPGAARVPIGRPVANTRLYVLDAALAPVPVGVAGELFIGGVQVARGYLGRPGLTAERFVPDPFAPGARLYRTGDRARWAEDGVVEYLGRTDFQIKLRGFRIEPGEIEAVAQEHPRVRQAVVVAREDAPGTARLVAYLLPRGDAAAVVDEVRAHLQRTLPEHMVPAAWVVLDEVPLTSSGKADRRALPAPAPAPPSGPAGPSSPRTPTEEILAGIWAQVLGVEAVGPDDSFFTLGGHSLLATRVASRVRQAFGVELPLRAVFDAPTLPGLAARVDALRSGGAEADAPPLAAADREGPVLLSFAQQRLWFLDQLEPGSAAYNLVQVLRLRGPLDEATLARALGEVVRRHEALRTVFPADEGRPVQRVLAPAPVPLARVDLRALPAAEREREARRAARAEGTRPFDLARGPLLRALLVRMDAGEAVGVLTVHHIVSDGWSGDLVSAELAALYDAFSRGAPSPLPEPALQYADYAAWQRAWLHGPALERQTAYWRDRLAGAPPLLELPTDRPRPPVAGTEAGTRPFALSAELSERLRALGRREGVTLFMTLLAAWQALLGRMGGADDVPVGTPVAGRGRVETEGVVGLFVNTLVLRGDLSGDPSFRALLARARDEALGAWAHQDVPFEKLVDEMGVERTLAHAPLFQVMLVMQDARGGPLSLGPVRAEPVATEALTARFDLTLEVEDRPGALRGTLDYRADLFDGATAERILACLACLLEGAADDPDLPLSRLPILPPAERERVVRGWNRTEAELDGPPLVHQWIEAHAARTPDAPALTCEGATLTYAELNARANRLAHHLRARGVGPEVRVGVCAERSHELVVALLAVMKAGGAYVPLDPGYPAERLVYMVEDSAIRLLLVQPHTAEMVPAGGAEVLVLRPDALGDGPAEDPEVPLHPLNAVYVIYTSGSTGRPKGVVNSHAGVRNRLAWMRGRFGMGPGRVVMQKTPFSFDISVWELFAPLMMGGRLVLARPGGHRDGEYLAQLAAAEGITDLHFVPSMLSAFLETPGLERLATVRRLYCAGEAVSRELMQRVFERLPGVEYHNTYGPTEAAVDVSHWQCVPGASRVTIGTPLPNTQLYVLDERMEPVPTGVAGELYLGGVQLARGYLGRPGLTADRFVPDPFTPGARMYRSGDRARWTAGGEVEYLGRTDFQVKLRGFRIEPGEIEAVLEEHEQVRQAAVVLREDVPGAPRLVAYLVARDGAGPGLADEARARLERRLPEYMVPAALVVTDRIPLTPSGKLDRRALPAPAAEAAAAFTAPRTPAERAVARCWAEVLGGVRAGAHDNFFALGGDSILSIQVVARLRRAGWQVAARDLFEHPTLAGLAGVAVPVEGAPAAAAEAEAEEEGEAPLTPIQAWFFAVQPDDPHHFTLPVLLQPREAVEVDALRRALDAVAAHHPALRARFRRGADGWGTADPAPAGPVPFACVDLAGLDAEARAAALGAAAAEMQAGLDLQRGVLLRAALFTGDGGWARLFLAVHHLATDGVSWRVLLDDLQAAYDAARAGAAPVLPPRTASFAAWARALARRAAGGEFDGELPYWTSRARRAPRALPADFAPAEDPAGEAAEVAAVLDAETTRALLRDVPPVFRTGMDDALVAALAGTLAAWTGEGRVWVDVEGHGRDDRSGMDTSRTVGWFTTLYPVLLEVEPGMDDGAALRAVKEQLRAVPGRGLGYGALRWMGSAHARGALAAAPGPEVVFTYLGQVGGPASAGRFAFAGERTGPARSPRAPRPHALEVAALVEDGALRVVWTYGPGRHRRETVQALADGFLARLRALVAHCARADAACTPSDFPLAGLDAAGLAALTAPSRAVEDVYPLTPLQEGMLFHTRDGGHGGAYVGRFAFELRGALDEAAFAQAWRAVMDRHPVLRTRFAWEGIPAPLQVVERQPALPLQADDWRGLPAAEREARWAALVDADRARGMDVRHAPPMRLALVRTDADAWRVLWSHHHLLLDGWSVGRVYADLLAFYAAFAAGRAPAPAAEPPPYRRYVEWLGARAPGDAEAFWRGALGGVAGATPLGVDHRADPAAPAAHGGAARELPADATAALAAFARSHGLTLNTVVQAAWALLMARYSGEDDVVFGATVSGRPAELPAVEVMVGLFINTLPVRVRVDAAAPVGEWLRGIQAWSAAAREHEHAPLVQVQRWSGVPAGEPLFESLLVFENFPVADVLAGAEAPGLAVRDLPMPGIATHYPLSLTVIPGASLRLQATFDARRLEGGDVERMLAHLEGVLAALAEDAGRRVAEVPLLGQEEARRVLALAAGPVAEVPRLAGIHAPFEERVRRAPDAAALVHGAEVLTYGALDRRANRLANHLRARGVGPEVRVAVFLERGPAAVTAMLAVLKAGGVYVPLDAAYPAGRLAFMLEDSGARLVVTESRLLDRLPDSGAGRVVLDADAIDPESDEPSPSIGLAPENLAYVVYTSGSTGRPKGVLTPHAGALNYLAFLQAEYGVGPADTVLQLAPLSFDASIRDVLGPLSLGARLVIPTPGEAADPARLLDLARSHGVTALMSAVPSGLRALLAAADGDGPLPLRLLLMSGEALPVDDCRRARALFGAEVRIVNQWGATECTMSSTFHAVRDDEPGPIAPIGRPGLNARVYVLDAELRPLPIGVAGEAYIATPGVARGYGDRPALTAERFVPDPFSAAPGARMYRVGDRVRRRADGVLEYLGRTDQQVKVQGVRVEPGEVEAALRAHPAVRQAAVVAWRDGAGEHRLAAYVVGDEPAGEAELRAHLAGMLPPALIPARFLPIDRIPLLPNGKLDRRALPRPDASPAAPRGHVPPRTPTEELLAAVWAHLLGAERVGADDDFFALGGHSLLAMRVAARVREALGVELPLRALFEDATVRRLAARIDALRADGGDPAPPLVPVPRDRPLPLSLAQQRLWFAHRMEPGGAAWNMPSALRLRGALDVDALRRALGAVVERHEVLRTRFAMAAGEGVQVVEPAADIPLPLLVLDGLPGAAREAEVERLALAEAARPFDLERAPLLRAALLRLAEDEHVLLLTLHHVAADGWSLEVLVREAGALYTAFRASRPSPLAPLAVQYGDFAAWQRARLGPAALERELAWWRAGLAGVPAALPLPADFAPPAVPADKAGVAERPLSPQAAAGVRALARRESATPYMALAAALAVLLYRYTGEDDLVLGAPAANRTRPEVQGLVGFFVNLLPLRVRMAGNPAFHALLRQVRGAALDAFSHAEVPFEMLVQAAGGERAPGRRPLVQVGLELERPAEAAALEGIGVSAVPVHTRRAKFDLELRVIEDADGGWTGRLYYDPSLYLPATGARLLDDFAAVLEQAAADPELRVLELALEGDAPHAAPVLAGADADDDFAL